MYSRDGLQRFHESFKSPPLSDDFKEMLEWVGLDNVECLPTEKEWCQFVRVLNVRKGTPNKDFEAIVLPSWGALIRHFKRALYVLKLPFSAPFAGCSVLNNVDEYGLSFYIRLSIIIKFTAIIIICILYQLV